MGKLLFTEDHDWVRVEEDRAYIGITDFAQSSLGDIVFVELPAVGTVISSGKVFTAVESVKAVADIKAPVSGTVLEVNETLGDEPELLNEAPYEHWIVAVELSKPEELEGLLDEDAYGEFCEKQ